MDAETIPTAAVDPNAPAPSGLPVTPVPAAEPMPAPAQTVPTDLPPIPEPGSVVPPVPSDSDLIAAEDKAGADLAAATESARLAGKAVIDATANEAAARAALGTRVNAKGGLVILDGSQTARVLLPDGNGAYHPISLPTVTVTK